MHLRNPRSHRPRRPRARSRSATVVLLAVLAVASGCMSAPGDTSGIEWVSTLTTGGWRYDYYRNSSYGCAISGYQTFVTAEKVGSDPSAPRPLWVKMHGGGVGYFDAAGVPRPASNKTEESFTSLRNRFDDGITARLRAAPEGFRMMAVSMCSHDLYAGANTPDANNPNTLPDGTPRTTNGLLATKAAIQFMVGQRPTDDLLLHGGSAGSAGSFHVAWGLEQQGIEQPGLAPAGVIADSGILNQRWEQAQIDQSLPCARTADAVAIVPTRFHPEVADPLNQPDLLVTGGRLTVPLLHVWNHGDPNVCGQLPMTCNPGSGPNVVLGSADCVHEPMRRAIEAQGPTSRSANLALCVDDPGAVGDCDKHVVSTNGILTNTDPAFPADYNAVILTWIRARLADD